MAYIQPNKLLAPTSRVIRPYQCSFVATEGPNILGKLNMSGVEIPYESQFTTRIVLNPGAVKQPLLYGFLGTSVTFILLKFTYDETNPLCEIEEEQYVTYYFEDQPSIKRHANKLLLLTGNSTNRIPQLFLDNPSPVKVIVEALVANLQQPDIKLDDVNFVTIGNLYYNNIISDITSSHICYESGSTQLQIINMDGITQLYLDYVDILTIEPQYITNELKITTISDTTIILGFLSPFDMYQALSRISWVMKDSTKRYLTSSHPSVDTVPPVVELYPDITPIAPDTYVYPYVSGTTVYPEDIINYFIKSIEDERDGEIPLDAVNIVVRRYGQIEPLTGITSIGVYSVIMNVSDIANNQTTLNITIILDDTPPVITFKPVAQGTGFTMIENDMALPSAGITKNDIIFKSVSNVYDTVDGVIPNSQVEILLGLTPLTSIKVPGDYLITYYVEDRVGNSATYQKTLTYSGVTILDNGDTYEADFQPGVLSIDFKLVGTIGTTATVILSGQSFIVAVTGTTNVTELVWDLGGSTEYNFGTGFTGSIQIVVNGTQFDINFVGRASLLFDIVNNGAFDSYFEIIPDTLTFSYDSGLTDTFDINTNLNWEIQNNVDWVEFSSLSGTEDETITVTTTEKNITGDTRYGTINITGHKFNISEEDEFIVVQLSIPSIFEDEEVEFIEDSEYVYLGETGTTASIIINDEFFVISNSSGNTLIWDLGIDEYEFTVEDETISIEVLGEEYEIKFILNDDGRLVFSIIKL